MDNELKILNKIQTKLPNELTNLIYEYIPNKVKYFITKENYITNHMEINKLIPQEKYETYIRTIVRQDLDFVFNIVLHEHLVQWLFYMKNYIYKDEEYINYFYFIYFYALEYESVKCKTVCDYIINKIGLNKYKHKNKIIKHIIWRI